MKIHPDLVIRQFFRSCRDAFTAKDFQVMLSRVGIKSTIEECEDYLGSCESVFALSNQTYITRAATFTGAAFSIKPTQREIEKGVFIPGHRCMPFVDPDMLSCNLKFVYEGEELEKKVIELDNDTALDFFMLYGEEYSTQYIASDPANKGMNLADTDFMLPPKVKLTGVSIQRLIENENFKTGDRLLCKVADWDSGIVELIVIPHLTDRFQMNSLDISRETWFNKIEECFLESFDIIGPCASIEEQLALIFAEKSHCLCVYNAGSIEEFLNRTKKVGFESFGVETRLWRKNEDVPAIGIWNSRTEVIEDSDCKIRDNYDKQPASTYVVDCFLKNMIFQEKNDLEELFRHVYPNSHMYNPEQQKSLLLNLKSRHGILCKTYNRFADFEISNIRSKALELYEQVSELVSSIDLSGIKLSVFPQQPLVILSQILTHVTHILEIMETAPSCILAEAEEINLSVQGMEFNFEEISVLLKNVLAKETRKGFSVVK